EDYRDALRDALPHARSEQECGLSWLSGGSDAYDATLRYYTTTEKTALEIHEIGLAQVAKLADEYRSLGPEVVGTDDLQEIFEAMRTDPSCTSSTGTSWWTSRGSRWPGPRPPWPTGSRWCLRRRARCRGPRWVRRP